ncbi:MAG TPA: hypothetical protein PLJ00_01495 [Chitinophagales bacterium]|nr:hypothetical protein [Chitinophagales bacterium]HRG84808.1 hypothetical protein [Chitinophagales bacterium]HRH51853.1 hypothetical protein [Chitinophagales bacterium]
MLYWQALLIEWRKLGRKGLSVPYVLGSQIYLKNTTARQSINDLLISITANNIIKVYITYCPDIDGLILCHQDDSASKLLGLYPKINGNEQNNLFVTNFLAKFQVDLSFLISELLESHQEDISNGRFSRIDRAWQAFSIDEINFIRQTFKTYNL